MYYVNKDVEKTRRIFPEQGRGEYLRLDMNENPVGLPQNVVEKIRAAITPELLATYPEPDLFIKKYSDYLGVLPSQVCPTNGSDNAIRYILQIFAKPGHEVLTVTPSFEMYMVNCWLLGLVHKTVPYGADYHVDIDAIVDAIDDNTDIVVLVNPNNPIGDVYSEKDARRIVEAAAAHNAVVQIDEAYHYFTKNTLMGLIADYDNVIVTRTFSKCLSIAGVRLGVIVSNPTIIHYINNLRVTFEVNAFALKCGEIILDEPGLIENLAEIQISGRKFISASLEKAGYDVLQSDANFLSFRPKTNADELIELFKRHKILVKGFSGGPMAGWIRINTGSPEVMERFFCVLQEIDNDVAGGSLL